MNQDTKSLSLICAFCSFDTLVVSTSPNFPDELIVHLSEDRITTGLQLSHDSVLKLIKFLTEWKDEIQSKTESTEI